MPDSGAGEGGVSAGVCTGPRPPRRASRTAAGVGSLSKVPAGRWRLTPRGPIPRIAGLCRAGPSYTPAPKTATYKYRAASRRRPGVLLSLIAQVAPAAEIWRQDNDGDHG